MDQRCFTSHCQIYKNYFYLKIQVTTSWIKLIYFVTDVKSFKGNINKDHLDGTSLIVGVHTVLKQFNPAVNKKFIENMSQFAVLVTNQSIQWVLKEGGIFVLVNVLVCRQKGAEVPAEAVIAVKFLEIYTTYSEDSHDCFLAHMPEELLQLHHSLTTLAI